MHLQPFFTGHLCNPNSDDNSDWYPNKWITVTPCAKAGVQTERKSLMQPSWKPNSTSSSFGGCYTNSWITFILGDFWLNFSTFTTVFSHTHTSRGKPVWVSPTSTSTIWEADAPEVVGAINISWNVSQSTRGVGREKWHIAMNSLWRLHHENKKINHKDINSLTLKWNQQRIIHVRVHMYTHTLHTKTKTDVTPPS